MSESTDNTPTERVPPNGNAWQEAQRRVAERNEQTRREARAEREAHERGLEARRAERERGRVAR